MTFEEVYPALRLRDLERPDDRLLVSVTTKNRTVYLSATNPSEGRTDVARHASGKVRNGVSVRFYLVPVSTRPG